jgi:hypothetical protein
MKRDIPNKAIAGLALLLFTSGAAADPLSQWTWRFPSPQGNTLRAVAYGGGQFVAVGDGGTIISSPDGYSWTNQTSGVSSFLHGVAYADGQYAAVGDGGLILISSNAAAWTPAATITTDALRGIAGNSGWRTNGVAQFLAVGDSGVALAGTNASNWSALPRLTSNTLNAVIWNGFYFLVVGDQGMELFLAPDEFDVMPPLLVYTTNNLYAVAASGNGVVAAVGDLTPNPLAYTPYHTNRIIYSFDLGTTWQPQQWIIDQYGNPNLWQLSEYFILTGLTHGPNGFVGVGYTGYDLEYHPAVVMTSPTGTNWTELPASTSENPLNSVAWGNGLYVAVGDFGSIVVSTNSVNWHEVLPDRRGDIAVIACGTNLCIATASQAWYSWGFSDFSALVSTNGLNWTVSRTKSQLPTITDLDCGGIQFVGVSGTSIFTTQDGYNWQGNSSFTNAFHGVKFANGQFLAVGDNGNIFSSVDGTNWNNRSIPTAASFSFNSVAYGNGLYVAGGTIAANSPDGITWTVCASNLPATLTRIVYGRGLFVATAYSGGGYNPGGKILTSPDGVSWTIQFVEPNGEALSGIAYSGGLFVAISGFSGTIFQSTDGINWQPSAPALPLGLYIYYQPNYPGSYTTVCARNGAFFIGGMEGVIFQSGNTWNPPSLSLPHSTPKRFTFAFNQQIDVPYRIQTSSNLLDWGDVYGGVGTGQTTNFNYSATSNEPAKYFRIVSP